MTNDEMMRADLAKSGLLPEDMHCSLEPDNGFSGVPGYRIPYLYPDGTPHEAMFQTRLFVPNDKGQKYTQPIGVNFPYFTPGVDWEKVKAATFKCIIEGAKKSAAAWKHLGIAGIGINGCNNWHKKNGDDEVEKFPRELSDPIRAIINPGDVVYVVLDGDASSNDNVNHAMADLCVTLKELGCTPVAVRLPHSAKAKIGLDDWIMADPAAPKTLHDFLQLPTSDGRDYHETFASVVKRGGLRVRGKAAVNNLDNLRRAVMVTRCLEGRLSLNEQSGFFHLDGRVLSNADVTNLQCELQRRFFPDLSDKTTNELLRTLGTEATYRHHPLRDYLNGLVWDGEERLEFMFQNVFGVEDSDYTRAVGRNFLTAAVARALDPGCKADHMLILEGDQGIGKSTALEIMSAGHHLEVLSNMGSKDFYMEINTTWFADLSELGAFNKVDAMKIKQTLSMLNDAIRRPYDTRIEVLPRPCVFVGSTNSTMYLPDETGNRRFWPLRCIGEVRLTLLRKIIEQLHAEAVARYRAGETWHEVPIETAKQQQKNRARSGNNRFLEAVSGHISYAGNLVKGTFNGQAIEAISKGALMKQLDIRDDSQYRTLCSALRHFDFDNNPPLTPRNFDLDCGLFSEEDKNRGLTRIWFRYVKPRKNDTLPYLPTKPLKKLD